jgi:hypothetical protein
MVEFPVFGETKSPHRTLSCQRGSNGSLSDRRNMNDCRPTTALGLERIGLVALRAPLAILTAFVLACGLEAPVVSALPRLKRRPQQAIFRERRLRCSYAV